MPRAVVGASRYRETLKTINAAVILLIATAAEKRGEKKMSIVIVMLFIALDFITGIVMAVKNSNFNSSIMRDGLFNKFGEIVIVAVGFLIDYGQTYLDMGFSVPVLESICVYIILMEIGSILENVSRINKSLVPEKIREILEKAPKK